MPNTRYLMSPSIFAMCPNICAKEFGIIPRSSGTARTPSMVNVLPVPVCPYAKIVPSKIESNNNNSNQGCEKLEFQLVLQASSNVFLANAPPLIQQLPVGLHSLDPSTTIYLQEGIGKEFIHNYVLCTSWLESNNEAYMTTACIIIYVGLQPSKLRPF